MQDTENDHDAMLRWQERAQDHRSSVNNQFLTYAGALLGLEEAQLLAREGSALKWAAAFEVAGFLAGLSFVIGTIVVLVRLRDAQLTARIERLRFENPSGSGIDSLRRSCEHLGEWSNRLIPGQVVTFFLAVAAMIAWIVTTGWEKL